MVVKVYVAAMLPSLPELSLLPPEMAFIITN